MSLSEGYSRSCDSCRQRKVRCGRLKPSCLRCLKLGLECTRQQPYKRRGPKPKLIGSDITNSQKNWFNDLLRTNETSTDLITEWPPLPQSSPDLADDSQHLIGQYWISYYFKHRLFDIVVILEPQLMLLILLQHSEVLRQNNSDVEYRSLLHSIANIASWHKRLGIEVFHSNWLQYIAIANLEPFNISDQLDNEDEDVISVDINIIIRITQLLIDFGHKLSLGQATLTI